MSAPTHIGGYTQGFSEWVSDQGGEVLAPTNEWEVIRYRAKWRGTDTHAVHIIYRKANGILTYTGGSEGHYRAFMRGAPMEKLPRAEVPVQKVAKARPKRAKIRAKVLERDGPVCWFCGTFLNGDATLEHLVARANGGPNSLDNYALAHATCNLEAGNKPLVEKIALRQKKHEARADAPPWEITA